MLALRRDEPAQPSGPNSQKHIGKSAVLMADHKAGSDGASSIDSPSSLSEESSSNGSPRSNLDLPSHPGIFPGTSSSASYLLNKSTAPLHDVGISSSFLLEPPMLGTRPPPDLVPFSRGYRELSGEPRARLGDIGMSSSKRPRMMSRAPTHTISAPPDTSPPQFCAFDNDVSPPASSASHLDAVSSVSSPSPSPLVSAIKASTYDWLGSDQSFTYSSYMSSLFDKESSTLPKPVPLRPGVSATPNPGMDAPPSSSSSCSNAIPTPSEKNAEFVSLPSVDIGSIMNGQKEPSLLQELVADSNMVFNT